MTAGMEGGPGMRAHLEEQGLWNYGRTMSSHLTLATPVGFCWGTTRLLPCDSRPMNLTTAQTVSLRKSSPSQTWMC